MVELSSLDVHFLARELGALEDAYVDKVYQPAANEYLLKVRPPRQAAVQLVLRVGQFAALQPGPVETPEAPSVVAMSLRKHLSGARLRRVEQHAFDRVLTFDFDAKGRPLRLVLELFGKGNLILADPEDRILLAHRTETFSHRTIRRGETLKFPPARSNPKTMTPQDFEGVAAKSTKDVVRFLATDVGLGGDLAEEVTHRAGLRKDQGMKTLVDSDVGRLWSNLQQLLQSVPRPSLARTATRVRVSSLTFESEAFRGETHEPAATLSEAILGADQAQSAAAPAPPDEERERLRRQLEHQERAVGELDGEAQQWERRGQTLYERYVEAAPLLETLRALLRDEGAAAIQKRLRKPTSADAWAASVVRFDPEHRRFTVRLGEIDLPLDPRESLERNASLLFDEAKHVRAKIEGARAALEETRRRLADRPAPAPRAARAARAPAKRFWFETFRWFFTSERLLVVAGRDAASNEKLVKRHLNAGDVYVHADFHGAPSCIVKAQGKPPGPATLEQACQFAATFSRAFAQFAQADAYWVRPEQVSKTAESGEYVPKGAFIIRGQRNYHHKLKLEAAIGLVRLTKEGTLGGADAPYPRLMSGPAAAVALVTGRYVVVERGATKPADAAKKLAPVFGVTLDEVQAVLPPGTIRISEGQGAG